MKNLPVIIGIILLLVLIGGGVMFMNRNASQSPQVPAQQAGGTEETTSAGGALQSLKDLMTAGKSQTCTFESGDASTGKSTGTVYIAGNKVRADFSTTGTDGQNYAGSMINDGTYMYNWDSATKQGMKIAITEEMQKTTEEIKNDNQNAYLNPDEKGTYNCQGWGTDSSKFAPPADVTFTDYSAMMKNIQDQTAGMKQTQCAACAQLEGESQAMCKKSLGC